MFATKTWHIRTISFSDSCTVKLYVQGTWSKCSKFVHKVRKYVLQVSHICQNICLCFTEPTYFIYTWSKPNMIEQVGPTPESHSILKWILGSITFWVQKSFWSKKVLSPKKFFVQKGFGSKKVLGLKKFWVLNNFWFKKFWVRTNLWSKKILGPKKLVPKKHCVQRNVELKKFWVQENFW